MSGYVGPTVAGVHIRVSPIKPRLSLDGALPVTGSASVRTAVGSPGASTGTLVSCSIGDHSVTSMSGPGETTCTISNNTDDASGPKSPHGLKGSKNTFKHLNPINAPSRAATIRPSTYVTTKSCYGCVASVTCDNETVVESRGT